MTWGSFLHGVALLAAVWGGCAWIAWTVVSRRHPVTRGATRVAALGVTFTVALVAVHIVPAALGILGRGSVLVLTLAAVAASTRIPARAGSTAERVADGPSAPWMWLLPAVVGLVVIARTIAHLRPIVARPPDGIDLLAFHLPDVASWLQSRTIWHNDQFAPLFANGNYPQSADIPFLAAMLPFSQDFLVRLVVVPFWPLLAVTLYALGRELGAPRSSSTLAALAVCATPVVLEATFVAVQIDVIMYAMFAAGVLFLLRARRTRLVTDLVLGGAALGMAFGSKWYGVPAVAVVVGGWWLWQLAGQRSREMMLTGLRLAGITALVGGIWLLRNLVLTGNPVFPATVEPLGITLFDAPPDVIGERYGFTIADYLTDTGVLIDHIVPAWWRAFGLVGPALVLTAVACTVLAWRGRRDAGEGARVAAALVGAAAAISVLYFITPNTALGFPGHPSLVEENSRYWMPAVLVLAPCAAWLAGRAGRLHVVVDLALAGAAIQAVLHANGIAPAADDVVRAGAGVIALGVGGALAARSVRRRVALPSRAAVVVTLVAAALVGGHRLAVDEAAGRYEAEPVLSRLQDVPAGTRIGLAGSWTVNGLSPVYPAFGPRLRSVVEYVGPFRRHLLQDYADGQAFGTALVEGDYDLLLVGRARRVDGASIPFARWARDAGWREVMRDTRSILFAPP